MSLTSPSILFDLNEDLKKKKTVFTSPFLFLANNIIRRKTN